jgi:UTP--glucose-1-phosphate uridylyltransferase
MALLLAEGVPVHGVVYRGIRYDTGLPLGYLQTVVQLAVKREDLGPAFSEWLIDYVKRDLGEAKPNTD